MLPIKLNIEGHVLITDCQTEEILLDKKNAIHPENMSEALALSLADRTKGTIYAMAFGNGAATVSGTGAVTYFPPNTKGADAELYNRTYVKVVDDNSPQDTNTAQNFISVHHVSGYMFSDVVVTCFLDYGEPSTELVFDTATGMNDLFIFNELALYSYDSSATNALGKLLTHCIFHPVQKSLNRTIKVTYTLRIMMT